MVPGTAKSAFRGIVSPELLNEDRKLRPLVEARGCATVNLLDSVQAVFSVHTEVTNSQVDKLGRRPRFVTFVSYGQPGPKEGAKLWSRTTSGVLHRRSPEHSQVAPANPPRSATNRRAGCYRS